MNLKLMAVTCFLAMVGCAHDKSAEGEAPREKQASASSIEAVRKRAAFEMSCPAESLEVTVLETGNMMRPWTFGAAGCDKRATYLYRAGTIINQSMSAAPQP
jgi:hypothetical protein